MSSQLRLDIKGSIYSLTDYLLHFIDDVLSENENTNPILERTCRTLGR